MQLVCQELGPGYHMATFKTKDLLDAVKYAFSKGYGPPVAYIGLRNNVTSHEMYR